jgi:hypothetical protein
MQLPPSCNERLTAEECGGADLTCLWDGDQCIDKPELSDTDFVEDADADADADAPEPEFELELELPPVPESPPAPEICNLIQEQDRCISNNCLWDLSSSECK